MTPHIKALGGKDIRRDIFLEKLAETQARELRIFGV
jgi:Leu/Phe-tRNA-protein transferase